MLQELMAKIIATVFRIQGLVAIWETFIFGSDSSGGSASLLGPNVDNISVTMTYDPVVLTTAQTSQISTAVEEIEEIEEYKFEELSLKKLNLKK